MGLKYGAIHSTDAHKFMVIVRLRILNVLYMTSFGACVPHVCRYAPPSQQEAEC
jgi:hypothetical protein